MFSKKHKMKKWSPDKRQKTGHKKGKAMKHMPGKKMSNKKVRDVNQDPPMQSVGKDPSANRADMELKRLVGE